MVLKVLRFPRHGSTIKMSDNCIMISSQCTFRMKCCVFVSCACFIHQKGDTVAAWWYCWRAQYKIITHESSYQIIRIYVAVAVFLFERVNDYGLDRASNVITLQNNWSI